MSDIPVLSLKIQRPVQGVLWMLVSGLCFLAVNVLVKIFGQGLPAAESAFLRFAFGLVFLIPAIRPMLATRLTPAATRLVLGRGVVHTIGVIFWFYAMTQIPIAEVTAMNYLTPIYVTIGAALFLGEKLALRRVLAIVVAFIGVLIILRPGLREVSSGHLAMLGTTLTFGMSYLIAKRLSDTLSPAMIVAYLSLTVTIGLAPPALLNWVTPTGAQMLGLFAVAAFATAGHFAMTLAFRAAPMTVTQPVTFLQLVWATLFGILMFNEPADAWVLLGGGLIIASVGYITLREAMVKSSPQRGPDIAPEA